MPDENSSDIITLVKKSGQKIHGINAAVQARMIFIPDGSVPIDNEDQLVRVLPNGGEETYRVKDRGYCHKTGSLPAHYQVKVERENGVGGASAPQAARVYHLSGPEWVPAAALVESPREAISITQREIFTELRKAIVAQLVPAECTRWIIAVDEMERAVRTPDYTRKYKSFIALAANHLSLISPFIPALSQLLN